MSITRQSMAEQLAFLGFKRTAEPVQDRTQGTREQVAKTDDDREWLEHMERTFMRSEM